MSNLQIAEVVKATTEELLSGVTSFSNMSAHDKSKHIQAFLNAKDGLAANLMTEANNHPVLKNLLHGWISNGNVRMAIQEHTFAHLPGPVPQPSRPPENKR